MNLVEKHLVKGKQRNSLIGKYMAQLRSTPPPIVWEAEALALFAAMTTPPTEQRKVLYNNLYKALKINNTLLAMDVLYITAADNPQAASLNLAAPSTYPLVPVNSPTFVQDRGYYGNGTSSYLETGFAPSNTFFGSAGAAGAGIYIRDFRGDAGVNRDMGMSNNALNGPNLRLSPDTDVCNISNTAATAAEVSNIPGFLSVARAGGNILKYFNGAFVASAAEASSGGLSSVDTIHLLGSGTSFSQRQQSAAYFGYLLDSTEQPRVYAAIQAFLTGVGAAV